jgi:hypothetical protein
VISANSTYFFNFEAYFKGRHANGCFGGKPGRRTWGGSGLRAMGGESRDSSLADERETQNKKAAPDTGAAFLSA